MLLAAHSRLSDGRKPAMCRPPLQCLPHSRDKGFIHWSPCQARDDGGCDTVFRVTEPLLCVIAPQPTFRMTVGGGVPLQWLIPTSNQIHAILISPLSAVSGAVRRR